jgi:N-acyl-D-aspartate/D-glutamate deacylase
MKYTVLLLLLAAPYDLLLRGGRIIDGTGNPWFSADAGIEDGRIVAVGALDASEARRVIGLDSLVVAPGFIDLHSPADRIRFQRNSA